MFKYTDEWAEEIYFLTKKKAIESEEEYYLIELYEKADYTKDIKAVAALIKCLEVPETGREQSIYGTLSTVRYELYYQAVFQYGSLLLDSSNSVAAITLLEWTSRDLTKQELVEITLIANRYLDEKFYAKYIKAIEEWNYEEDEPYSTFYQYFKMKFKDKND